MKIYSNITKQKQGNNNNHVMLSNLFNLKWSPQIKRENRQSKGRLMHIAQLV